MTRPSPWSSLIATIPRVFALANSEIITFFTTPWRVAMRTNRSSVKFRRLTTAVISSSLPRERSTLMLCPFAWRLLSGISWTFTQYDLPWLVMKST